MDADLTKQLQHMIRVAPIAQAAAAMHPDNAPIVGVAQSTASDAALARAVLALSEELERLRHQVENSGE